MSYQEHPQQAERNRDWVWPLWPLVPLFPYGNRRTLRKEIIKDTIWTFDQLQGILYVAVPIRMTVVKLDEGGLLVYAPVAPTPECVRLMRELEAQHGQVKYIILPTVSGLEHKVFVGPFARKFPKAQVYVAPDQWSFPLKLPLSWLGFPLGRTHRLTKDCTQTPFCDEFDYEILGPIALGIGPFEEIALYHRRSRTLLVTDAVLTIPETPPDILQLVPYPLLFHARDHGYDQVDDTWEARCKGWQRIALFAFYFRPSAAETVPLGKAIREAVNAPDRRKINYFGLFPFRWRSHWKKTFDALRGNGRLLVAPILQTLILNRAPEETLDWVYRVSCWDFKRIIPCHFESPIEANAHQFREAFAFLESDIDDDDQFVQVQAGGLFKEDLELLRELDGTLTRRGITPPAKIKS